MSFAPFDCDPALEAQTADTTCHYCGLPIPDTSDVFVFASISVDGDILWHAVHTDCSPEPV